MSSLRKLQRGDVLSVVQELRKLMSTIESAGYTVYADFNEIDSHLEAEAESLRSALVFASGRTQKFLQVLESTEAYRSMHAETMRRRNKGQL